MVLIDSSSSTPSIKVSLLQSLLMEENGIFIFQPKRGSIKSDAYISSILSKGNQRTSVSTLKGIYNMIAFVLGCLNRLLSVDQFLDSRCQNRLSSAWRPRIFKEVKSTRAPQWRPMAFFRTI